MTDPQPWTSPGTAVAGDKSASARTVPPPPAEPAENHVGEVPLRPLGVIEIVDASITTIRRSPRATLGFSLVFTSLIQILLTLGTYLALGDSARDELTSDAMERALGIQAIAFLTNLVMTALAILVLAGLIGPVVARTLAGQTVSLATAWQDVRSRFLALLGVSAAVTLISLLALVLPLAPSIVVGAADGPPGLGVVAVLLGLPAGFALMFWLYVKFALSTPALTVERRSMAGAFKRSRTLVRRRWWRTFGALLLALLVTIFINFFAMRIPFVIAQLLIVGFTDEVEGWTLVAVIAIDTAGRIVAGTLTNPFNAGVIALLYADTRMRREGFDLELATREDAAPSSVQELWLPSALTDVPDIDGPKRPSGPRLVSPRGASPPAPGQYPAPGHATVPGRPPGVTR